ncbi:EAL domain-containing protein [Paucibacter sp. R3-3]|uniref:EAL domain-containing protein n=1 Tax=Roseateles agri TaxID=3098619 RepID=A0ABU5DL71_9BURK|nr:EAL domain-containing protein [Paucibacter sp. R3-3]MDY0747049.1 EAL domain-containing protein [Paucibacter sp. R3-3]
MKSESVMEMPAGPFDDEGLRARRLSQLAVMVMTALCMAGLVGLVRQDWRTLSFIVIALVFIGFSMGLARRRRVTAAALLLLWTLALIASAAMWTNQGIYSPALLVYPVVLVIASMLVERVHLLALLAMMGCNLGAMTWMSVSGAHAFDIRPPNYGVLAYVLTILGTFSAAILLLAGDLRRALERVRTEVQRVQQSSEQLRYFAEHDQLTGLPNRRLGSVLFEQALGTARRNGSSLAVMFVDLDNFKTINDSFGHSVGDDFLREAAERLRAAVRSSDTVLRQGGDEFLVLLPDARDATAVSAAASHVLTSLSRPYSIREITVTSSCSIGVAMFPGESQDFETLVKKADLAMHHAKDAGRNAIRFFDEAMNANMVEDLMLGTGLAQAMERGELSLHFQSQLDLATGRLVGAEALLRWQHPELGWISPGRFIPIAERSGLIVEIGQWVIDEACRQLRCWQDTGLGHLVLSVNVSTIQFKRGTIDLVVGQALAKHGISPASLELEVTESALIHDAETFVATLARLKSLGVGLAIDDFGTGYSNLSYLQRFEVDKLKIDQSFVRRLSASESDQAIVRAIVQMAKSLKLTTTGEGIEDEVTAALLRELGCELGQGYLFSRPLPLAAFEELARRHPANARHAGSASPMPA